MESQFETRTSYLSCPVVRPAQPDDAWEIASMVIQSNSDFIESVFNGDIQGGYQILKTQFKDYIEGVYVLAEGTRIVGVMKIHLPDQLIGNTVSYKELIRSLGYANGIRAGILLSHWDEYKPDPHEAYIEYLYTHYDFDEIAVKEILLQKAFELASQVNAKYVTHFVSTTDYVDRHIFENEGFVLRKKTRSILAKLYQANHTSWYKATYNLTDHPITVREYVAEKIDNVKQIWVQRRREIIAAVRITLALTVLPIIAGTLAYMRGYPLAVMFWAVIGSVHLIGVKLYLSGSTFGRFGLAIALISEGVNLVGRSISTSSWLDRTWLLPTALLTFYISSIMIRYPGQVYYKPQTTA